MVFIHIKPYAINSDHITHFKEEYSKEPTTKIFFNGGQTITIDMDVDEFRNLLDVKIYEDTKGRKSCNCNDRGC